MRTMTHDAYVAKRDTLLAEQAPYRTFSPNEVFALGENRYQVGDTTFAVTDVVQTQLDAIKGLSKRQLKHFADSETSLTDMRNIFAMTSCVDNATRFALVADGQSMVVDGLVPIKQSALPMEMFFNVVDMFADKNNFEVARIETATHATLGLVVIFSPIHKEYDVFAPNDKFLKNCFYMRWNLGGIELGNYVERLVCTNGMMEVSRHNIATIHDFADNTLSQFISDPMTSPITVKNLSNIKELATRAADTQASISELHSAQAILTRHGAPADVAEQLIPYRTLLEQYKQAGFSHYPAKKMKADISAWETYNRVTDFASHSPLLADDDMNRSSMLQEITAWLGQPRDIKKYADIFIDRT